MWNKYCDILLMKKQLPLPGIGSAYNKCVQFADMSIV